jgi:hypothetical protein
LRIIYKGQLIEGTPEEIKEFIDANPSASKQLASDRQYDPARISQIRVPEVEEIIRYIKTKESYVNNWGDVQDHFIGQRLKSRVRGEPNHDYQFFQTRYRLARKHIEDEEGGKFKEEDDGYKFVK